MPCVWDMAGNLPISLPPVFVSESFTVSYCLNCRLGDCPIYGHTCNYLHDHTAALMNILCSDVSVEPQLQPLSGKQLSLYSANRENHARSDVAVTDFWSKNGQQSCFNIRVFNPLASSNHASVNSVYQKHKKRQEYNQQVREIEHGCFSPLVFNTNGRMGRLHKWFTRLADLIADKLHKPYKCHCSANKM